MLKKKWLEDIYNFKEAKDMDDFHSYLRSKRCFYIKAGINVSINKFPDQFDNTVGFVYDNTQMWSVVNALDYGVQH
ncbi:hypothetical protein SAMN05421863_108810 [Nitrosomonas communis]|uniref:Uncharacterized protein n=1 Tax=Nitrosomonas communis TaxID=44574 RepID=A0A1I4VPX3_9PROT|nr:hypothetical protein SAMN05421863_108810 [Nitrosomonas communis]